MAIINNNDMEIIMRGDQTNVIRKMLENRLFAVMSMPAQKPSKYTSSFSSSVFLAHMSCFTVFCFGIRKRGDKTVFEHCEKYLMLYYIRGKDKERRKYFDNSLKRTTFHGTTVTSPEIDDFLTFMTDKEMFCITNYAEHHGNLERSKADHFQDDFLLLRENAENQYILYDEYLDVRLFLTRINDECCVKTGLYPEDIRKLDINRKLIDIIEKNSKKQYYDENYYSVEYESASPDIQASYFLTCFHSNTAWNADPICIMNFRISAFVLPGTITFMEAKKLPVKSITKNFVDEAEYKIESIHFNSDICDDISEFKTLIESFLFDRCLA